MPSSEKRTLRLEASREELSKNFRQLTKPADVAELLEIDYWLLLYFLYRIPDSGKYHTFNIKKRSTSSSMRTISAPVNPLKIIQRKLSDVLVSIYSPKASVHGFTEGRSILSNARRHVAQKFVLNIDLADFFPSINFGRVRGMFMGKPYEANDKVATVLAQICCFNNQLPQGAPTSPIISNMICAKMDSELRLLAQRNRCNYTRYADDITFSTSAPKFPRQLATVMIEDSGNYIQIGEQLNKTVESNGFLINPDKTRLQTRTHRQEVTGLVTNEFPNVKRHYIRQVRAMLHAWEKYGLEKAEQEHFTKYRNRDRNPHKEHAERRLSYLDILQGKIEFIGAIRGRTDFIYINLLTKLIDLEPTLANQISKVTSRLPIGVGRRLHVITEGCTDWMHMKAAFAEYSRRGLYADMVLELREEERDMGHGPLLSNLKAYANLPPTGETVYVFVFDSDVRDVNNEVNDGDTYREWAPNVFSFSIPVPRHRSSTPLISTEFYYQDSEIMREDSNGRRLYLSSEFDPHSKRHNSLPNISCTDKRQFGREVIYIIDDGVFDPPRNNIALPKKHFAKYVLDQESNFNDFNFSSFSLIFDQLLSILSSSSP